jgi:hypothetical protein
MFADEKGYLVTEMVWEEFSDDEYEAADTIPVIKPQKDSPKPAKAKPIGKGESQDSAKDDLPAKEKKSAGKKVANKNDTASNAKKGGTQKSMTSFFTKK